MYVLCKFSKIAHKCRSFSSAANKLIDVITDEKSHITKASLQRPPVNSLNTQLLTEIGYVVDDLEKTKCKGLILTSNVPNIFTAGLDLMEFYKTDAQRLETFWTVLQNTWLKLYTASFPTVALINGHSPAGGCLLAMSCDYRVMLGPHFSIGLNEAKIGIPAPFWFMDVMKNIIGNRKTELSVLSGRMYKTDEALAIGLIDEVANNQAEAETKVSLYLKDVISCAADSRAITKKEFRSDNVHKFLRKKDEERKFVIDLMLTPKAQKKFELYFEAMKKKN